MSATRAGIRIVLPSELLAEAETAAREHNLSVHEFAKQILESYVASRRLRSVPPILRKNGQGRRSDVLGYGD